jgi:hypothetical protein
MGTRTMLVRVIPVVAAMAGALSTTAAAAATPDRPAPSATMTASLTGVGPAGRRRLAERGSPGRHLDRDDLIDDHATGHRVCPAGASLTNTVPSVLARWAGSSGE